jgi:hypothetical protein
MIKIEKIQGFLFLSTVFLGFNGFGQEFTPANSSVSLKAEAVQSAGAPLLFTIRVKNISGQSIRFWNGGPGAYPNASNFAATVTDQLGSTRPIILENWQYTVGSGRPLEVKREASIEFPAASAPLPPGTYSFSVEKSPPIQIVVRRDTQLEQTYESALLAGLHRENPFSQQVAAHYKNERISEALLQDLLSDDLKVAVTAADALYYFRENLPKNSDMICGEALTKNIAAAMVYPHDVFSDPRRTLFVYLALILAECRSDRALESVIGLAHSSALNQYADEAGQGNQVRLQAVNALSQFPQPKVLNQLKGFLSDSDYMVQYAAMEALASRKDPSALEFLLTLAQTPKKPYRDESFNMLVGYYPHVLRVKAVLKKASRDKSYNIRFSAKEALKQLDRK